METTKSGLHHCEIGALLWDTGIAGTYTRASAGEFGEGKYLGEMGECWEKGHGLVCGGWARKAPLSGGIWSLMRPEDEWAGKEQGRGWGTSQANVKVGVFDFTPGRSVLEQPFIKSFTACALKGITGGKLLATGE